MNATRLAVLVGLFACGERSSLEPGSRPDHLAFSVQPGTSAVGSPIIPAVQVSVLDASGNLLTGFSGQVTVALYSQECGDSLSGTTTVNAVAGVAAFQAWQRYDLAQRQSVSDQFQQASQFAASRFGG